jgi:hypothetical protein
MKPLTTAEKRALIQVSSLVLGIVLASKARSYVDSHQIDWALQCVAEHGATTRREVNNCIEQLYETTTYDVLRALSSGGLFLLLPMYGYFFAHKHIKDKG